MGASLKKLGFHEGLAEKSHLVHVKAPIFSFSKLPKVDSSLGPEMKSTGEVMGTDRTLSKALYKAFVASGFHLPSHGNVLFTIADRDKKEALSLAERFSRLGYMLWATAGTAAYLRSHQLRVKELGKISDQADNPVAAMRSGQLQLVVNTLETDELLEPDGRQIRSAAIENAVPLFTSLDTVAAFLQVLESRSFEVDAIEERQLQL